MTVPARPAAVRRHRRRLAAGQRLPATTATATAVFDRLGNCNWKAPPSRQDRLARAVAGHWIRWSGCSAGVDEELAPCSGTTWQILHQAGSGDWEATKTDVFSEEFCCSVLWKKAAIRRTRPPCC